MQYSNLLNFERVGRVGRAFKGAKNRDGGNIISDMGKEKFYFRAMGRKLNVRPFIKFYYRRLLARPEEAIKQMGPFSCLKELFTLSTRPNLLQNK